MNMIEDLSKDERTLLCSEADGTENIVGSKAVRNIDTLKIRVDALEMQLEAAYQTLAVQRDALADLQLEHAMLLEESFKFLAKERR